MLFNSFAYLIFFFVGMLGAWALKNRAWQHSFLLLASFYFYASWNTYLLLLIIASALLDFLLASWMASAVSAGKRRLLLICSLSSNLGLLAFFNYTNFLLETAYSAQHWAGLGWMPAPLHVNVILPVGISFYTFQTLSYTVDVYRGKLTPIDNFQRFLLFISFFPQLIAGPIVRAADFLPQLAKRAEILSGNLKLGFTLFLGGLVKKVVFADSLGLFVEKVYSQPAVFDSASIVLATVAYAAQIYCDFSGYTDMAIGSATALGFWLPKNFDYPYLAGSVTEFWQRWHMSLSTWLRDYLYIPLGGNRKGRLRTYFNLLATMLLGGLWHGAKWTFVAWGAYQGLLLAAHRFYSEGVECNPRLHWFQQLRKTAPFRVLSIAGTLYLVLIGWIFFRAQNFHDLGCLLQKFILFNGGFHRYNGVTFREAITVAGLIAAFVTFHLVSYRTGRLAQKLATANDQVWCGCVSAGLLMLMLLAPSHSPEFIYFQF